MTRRLLAVTGLIIGAVALYVFGFQSSPSPIRVASAIAVVSGDGIDIFFDVENPGDADAVISARSEFGDLRVMRPKGLTTPITAEGSAAFSKDGVYLRLTSEKDLAQGDLVPVTLTMHSQRSLSFKARVKGPDDTAMDHSKHAMPSEMAGHDSATGLQLSVVPAAAEGWDVLLETTGFAFAEPQEPAMDKPGEGHAHLYLNGLKLGRMYEKTARIGPLLAGTYVVRVSLNTNTHMPVMTHGTPVEATVEITVE